jgi:hypothetical protein
MNSIHKNSSKRRANGRRLNSLRGLFHSSWWTSSNVIAKNAQEKRWKGLSYLLTSKIARKSLKEWS